MKSRRFMTIMIAILMFSIIISGCSAKNSSPMGETAPGAPNFTSTPQYDDAGKNEIIYDGEDSSGNIEPDKIITTISISMQTKEFIETTDKLNALTSKYKGYIENSNISYNNYIYDNRLKYSQYTLRVPRENIDNFVTELKEIANVISQNTGKTDITKQYRDTESRLKVLNVKEERILALLEKAEKMEDIIVLENQLSSIIYDKESLTANILDMDDKVDYSSVYIELNEVAKLTPGENVKTPFTTKVKNAFNDSLYIFKYNTENFIIGLIYFFPFGIILAVVGFVIFILVRKRRAFYRKNKDLPNDKE